MGRHSATPTGRPDAARPGRPGVPGRSRRRTLLTWVAAAAGVALAVVVSTVAIGGGRTAAPRAACPQGGTELRVAADPAIAPAVRQVAEGLAASPDCLTVRVSATDAPALAARVRALDPQLGVDVWIPESTLWLRLAQDPQRPTGWLPATAPPVARSPLVLALAAPVAAAAGWPGTTLSWADLPAGKGLPVRVGLADPNQSAVGLGTLLALTGAGSATPGEQAAAGIIAFQRGVAVVSASLSGLAAAGVPAFTADEQAVWAANAPGGSTASPSPGAGGPRLVALYPTGPAPALDFPFAVLGAPWVDPARQQAAATLRRALTGNQGRSALAAVGLRDANGTPGLPGGRERGVLDVPLVAAPLPDTGALQVLLGQWRAAETTSRVTALLDVSGSMGERVSGTDATKIELARQAAAAGVPLFASGSELGLWAFSTQLDKGSDWKVLVPTGPLTGDVNGVPRRQAMTAALAGLTFKPGGGTALYATSLAAFQDATANYAPGRLNLVVLLTDGRNDAPGGPTKEQLLATLQRDFRPDRPVRFVTIAYGDNADVTTLQEIAAATQGKAYVSRNPTDIRKIFVDALLNTTVPR